MAQQEVSPFNPMVPISGISNYSNSTEVNAAADEAVRLLVASDLPPRQCLLSALVIDSVRLLSDGKLLDTDPFMRNYDRLLPGAAVERNGDCIGRVVGGRIVRMVLTEDESVTLETFVGAPLHKDGETKVNLFGLDTFRSLTIAPPREDNNPRQATNVEERLSPEELRAALKTTAAIEQRRRARNPAAQPARRGRFSPPMTQVVYVKTGKSGPKPR